MSETSQKILIVEDSKNYMWTLSQTLEAAGFVIATAENGEEGIIAAQKEKPDLILLDITMPKMDGITTSKKLKELGVDVPIIFLTNLSDVKHISDAAETASDYIIKSEVSTEEVVNRVKARLALK
jgi:two-component system, OmpR family, response regulator